MSNLTGGSGSAAIGSAGDGGSQTPQGGVRVRTPRDVMNDRKEREERRRAEANEQALVEQQRGIELERRRSAQRRLLAATAQRDSGQRNTTARVGVPAPGHSGIYPPQGTTSAPPQVRGTPDTPTSTIPGPSTMPTGGDAQGPAGSADYSRQQRQPQPPTTTYSTQYEQAQRSHATPGFVPSAQAASASGLQQSSGQNQPSGDGGQARSNPSSFPHAFERWETLSSHWEGLTSYWIRKLEMNTEAIRRVDDISREQMSRQITDLSAAGANLFHAVVELQRLRASSERKFQRWFWDTRERQERDEEERQRLQTDLEAERRERAGLASRAAQAEMETRMAEMRRELQISRDEARRAWEELGRQEQEERDRQFRLREGNPIFVGGIQVLPMSAVSRGESVNQRTSTRDTTFATQGSAGGEEYVLQEPSPTDTDPFTSQELQPAPPLPMQPLPPPSVPTYPSVQQPSGMAQPSSQQPVQTSTAAQFYRQPETYLHDPARQAPPAPRSAFSEGSEEDPPAPEIDQYGNIRYDAQGRPVLFRPSATGAIPNIQGTSTIRPVPQQDAQDNSDNDFEVARNVAQERQQAARYLQQGQRPPQSPGTDPPSSAEQDTADYEGEGFGSGTGWDAIPRHQHPTRLSDVLEEEDERSRASPESRMGPRF